MNNRPTIILYIATSTDNYIAQKDGGVEWLSSKEFVEPSYDYGYRDFFNSVDAILLGNNTYEQMLTFGPWPNAGKHTYVFTHKNHTSDRKDISFTSEQPSQLIASLEPTVKRVWLEGGAQLVKSFYEAGLIDEVILTIVPVELKEGISLGIDFFQDKNFEVFEQKIMPKNISQISLRRVI